MSNRRDGRTKTKRAKAPSDSAGSFEDAPEMRPTRSLSQWLALSAKMVAGLVLIVGAVGALAWGVHRYAQTTPRFAVSNVEIEGTERLGREDVLGAAGVEKGQNLFVLDLEAAEKKLLQSPWISSARLTRKLPGTVRIEVSERNAVALAILGESTFLVDEEGYPFKKMGLGDPHDLPVVTGVSLAALAKDRRAELNRLRESLGLLRTYEKMGVASGLPAQEVHLDETGRAVLLVGQEGTALHLGASPWKQKLLRGERVLKKTTKSGGKPAVLFLDNEAHPERVVVRVR